MIFNYEAIRKRGIDIVNGQYSNFNIKINSVSLLEAEALAECRLCFEQDNNLTNLESALNDFDSKINNAVRASNSFKNARAKNPFAVFLPFTDNAIIAADNLLNAKVNSIIVGMNEIRSKSIPKQIYVSELDSLLTSVTVPSELLYLGEAANCLKQGYFKAAVVMGWCAAINRVHLKIEQLGFTQFNTTSATMKNATSGAYKRFNKTYSINSLSELREVFDNDVLWIVEGLGLIDSNERKRLVACFDLRNQSAHPNNTSTTKENAISFFSDIINIILTNQKFTISNTGEVV